MTSKKSFKKLKCMGPRGRAAGAGTAKGSIPRKFDSKLPISAAKKKNLMQICRTVVIPPEVHEISLKAYRQIPVHLTNLVNRILLRK